MRHATTRTRIGLALAVALAGLGSAARAQEVPVDGAGNLTPPDLSAPRSEQEYRTCPDREPPPAWIDDLEAWDVFRGGLVQDIYEARTYEAIVATGDCSCEIKAPPWDAAEAEYRENYAALDLGAVRSASGEFSRMARSLYRDVRRICREQGNW